MVKLRLIPVPLGFGVHNTTNTGFFGPTGAGSDIEPGKPRTGGTGQTRGRQGGKSGAGAEKAGSGNQNRDAEGQEYPSHLTLQITPKSDVRERTFLGTVAYFRVQKYAVDLRQTP